nr:katanin p80 WD40 repeat-containing subunit B1 homolog isoform X1 [Ipomoea trifida]
MANSKRGYKLQEFVAHSGNVNCLRFGKKSCRSFVTGGDDQTVNLWSIGKATSTASLSGHTSPIESVAFDTAEVSVVAGASSGLIKLWDLEETKMVRALSGHRSYCTAVEFHPFGEFFASGSMDTNLKIWDIRKKGCIHTYKGHTRGISTIRFTPDGRWVVSGGSDNVVKVWDLTAGKHLHDFKLHEGHIRSIDFHPLEFLLATGSADRTVKFWDLETFEVIGSSRQETAGVRSICFHPDGKTLFCGLDDSMKVYSWEPLVCHDSVDMGWSTLGDLCIHDGKLLGGAYYQNSVGVWVADISLIEPFAACVNPERNCDLELKDHPKECNLEGLGSNSSNSSPCCTSTDNDCTEIKNIYVDSEIPVTTKKLGSPLAPKAIHPSDSKDSDLSTLNQNSDVGLHSNTNEAVKNKSFILPNVVPRDSPQGKNSPSSRREAISFTRATAGMLPKPPRLRQSSSKKFDIEKVSTTLESEHMDNLAAAIDNRKDFNFQSRLIADDNARDSSEENDSTVKNGAERSEKNLLKSEIPYQKNVPAVQGRTRNLVERRVRLQAFDITPDTVPYSKQVKAKKSPLLLEKFDRRRRLRNDANFIADTVSYAKTEEAKATPLPITNQQTMGSAQTAECDNSIIENLMQNHDMLLSTFRLRLTKLQVVRHFWEKNDIKGAIDALRKLPDQSAQADILSVLTDRMEIITLDLFTALLPVLLDLLDSKVERHAHISLEMLLKLIAVFGPVVQSAVSAPPPVGVDLHAEERIECCRQCIAHFQIIQNTIPALIQRGGSLAKCAHQLNLVLQQP